MQAETIPDALFEGDWLSTSMPFKRNMLLTMTRMTRPVHFTVGKFSTLTLSTFVSVNFSLFADYLFV